MPRKVGDAREAGFTSSQYTSALLPPRTHQIWALLVLVPAVTLPLGKNTVHAVFGAPASVVADQYSADWTLVKGWPGGKAGPGLGTEGSTKLFSSCTEGNRQPFRPPVVRLAHSSLASN